MPESTKPLGIAVAVLVRETDHGQCVLLVRRANSDASSLNWVFPGGKIEAGETPKMAAQREVFEEAGIIAKRPKEIGRRIHPKTGVSIFYVTFKEAVACDYAPADVNIAEQAWVDVSKVESYFGDKMFPRVRNFLGIKEIDLDLPTIA